MSDFQDDDKHDEGSMQDAVAIIGMACRFPGAESVEAFWDNLVAGEESITLFSNEELLAAGISPEKVADPNYVKARGLIKDPELFDAAFFGISPREAELMDPQHRLFLETCWHALESAGQVPGKIEGSVGVWGGMSTGMTNNTYLLSNLHADPSLLGAADVLPAMLGNENDYLTTRVSYKLNLRGPSVNVQSACSTSLVAAAEAFQSLMTYGCDMALAGGVSVSFPQKDGHMYQEGDIGSPDGHCRPFDADARGTVFSNGVGAVVMKRLEDALADDDYIYAVIRGVAVNNDGSSKVSFAAPSVDGQAEVIATAQAVAGVEPETVSYIETHGTGTAIGDPIEVAGLTKAFATESDGDNTAWCGLGSVKSNFGHLDSAAGVAALIKTVLCLHHKTLVPTLHYKQPNPKINFSNSPFYVCSETRAWDSAPLPRRAGVSGFGIGGTNAHLVLEEAPPRAVANPSDATDNLLVVSAKTEAALKQAAANLGEYMRGSEDSALRDIACTLATGREQFRHRLSLVTSSVGDAAEALESFDRSRLNVGKTAPREASVVFMFPGGGAQYHNMARDLYQGDADFRGDIDHGLELFKSRHNYDLKAAWFAGESGQAEAELERPSVQLPAIFIVEMALARLWMRRGIEPQALIGHSMGENTAACLAGVMSYADTLGLVSLRGELFEQVEAGAMLSVALSPAEIEPYLNPDLCLATINAPDQCTISGTEAAIEQLQQGFEGDDVEAQRIPIRVAAHSHLLEPILSAFGDYLRSIALHPPSIPMISNRSGDWLREDEATDPQYWVEHLRHTVRFADGVQTLAEQDQRVFLEVGPGKILGSLVRLQQTQFANRIIASLRHAQEDTPDTRSILNALGKLWNCGVGIDWQQSGLPEGGRHIPLPLYPFQRKRFLIEPAGHIEHSVATPVAPTITPLPVPEAVAAAGSPPAESVSSIPRPQRILDKLQHIIQELSGLEADEIDPEVSFVDMGFDSLFLTQANLRFKKEFRIKITFRQLFDDAPCLAALAKYIDQQLPEDALQEEVQPAPVAAGQIHAPAIGDLPPAGDVSATLQQAIALQIQASNTVLSLLQSGAIATAEPAHAAHKIDVPESTADAPSATGRFGPFKPVQKSMSGELTAGQQTYLDGFIEAVQQRTGKSKDFTAEHRPHFADPRAVSGFKSAWKEITYPIVGERSKGSRMWDIDGNEYVDCAGGFGATFFGHAPDFILDALRAQMEVSLDYGPQSKIAGPTAKLLCELTGMDRASFCNTGSEAVLAAMRIARTVTGNDLIVTFSGDYHGIFDEVLAKPKAAGKQRVNMPIAPGIPASASQNILILDYGDPASLKVIEEHADELAAVLIEPIQSRTPELQPREFIHQLRKISKNAGIPMIFDEIITGFRLHPKGAQAWYDVEVDIACYGKVVGGGMPIGIVAGKAEYMDALDGGMWQYGDDSFPEAGVTYFAGTFIRHPLAIVAVKAVLEKIKRDGPALQRDINRRTAIFAEEINRHYHRMGVPVEMTYFGSVILPRFYGNPDFEGLFYHHLRHYGVHIWEGRPGFLTTEHSDQDMQTMIEAFVKAGETLIENGFFPEARERSAQDYPWTRAQREIWLTLIMGDEAIGAYNEQIVFEIAPEIDSEIDQKALELTLDKVVNRHASLRAVVQQDESGISVQAYMAPAVAFHDLSALSDSELNGATDTLMRENIDKPFDFKGGPLIRFSIIRKPAGKTLLCMSVSHLVCDGWSMEVIMQDIANYYSAMVQGRQADRGTPPTLDELGVIEQEKESSGELDDARQYWQKIFDPLPDDLDLPLDHERPRVKTYDGDRHALVLDADLNGKLRAYAREQHTTLFVVLLAAYYILLHKLSKSDDIVVGIPAAGHPNIGMNDLVTHMVSFLPVRKQIAPDQPFAEFVRALRDQFNDAKENQDLVYGDLVQLLKVPRNPGRLPLVSASFNMDLEMAPLWFDGTQAKFLTTPRSYVKYELFFNLIDEGESLSLEVDYNSDLFDERSVLRWVDFYQGILRDIADTPSTENTSVSHLQMLAPGDYEQLQAFNRTDTDYPGDLTVIDLLRQQVDRHGDKVAVLADAVTLSYLQLEQQSNQLAAYLQEKGVVPGDCVGLCLERSANMLVAALAIWKAGAAYVPLDPTYPQQRLLYMLEAAEVTAMVTEAGLQSLLQDYDCHRVLVDTDSAAISRQSTEPPTVDSVSEPLAYVIFTSGSTGKPKGVKIPHRAVTNFLCSMQREPGLEENDRLLAVTTLSFDIAVLELYLPLIAGASLCIAGAEDTIDGSRLLRLIEQHSINVMQATPASWRMLLSSGWRGGEQFKVLCGGEAFPLDLSQSLIADCGEVWNMYGPTETTVWSTCYRLAAGQKQVLIGHPIANTQCHVLDEQQQPVPIGVAGELYIGGDGVSAGYIGQAGLTGERFIPDPFSSRDGARLYRTGDRARWNRHGQLEYLQRLDDQVKLRGFRIELSEIEEALCAHEQVSECAAGVLEFGDADQRLVAWLCFKNGDSLTNTELRRHLRDSLPHYMIPQLFVELDQMPLTPNGKVDRKSLPEPLQAVNQPQQLTPPTTDTERQIVDIWCNALQIEEIGVDQYFFDIGGHSLLAVDVIRRIEAHFGVTVTPMDILLNSLEQIAAQIDQHLVLDKAVGLENSSNDGNIITRLFNKKMRK